MSGEQSCRKGSGSAALQSAQKESDISVIPENHLWLLYRGLSKNPTNQQKNTKKQPKTNKQTTPPKKPKKQTNPNK